MNNEVKKLSEQNPQGYGPKMPEIIDMAKKIALHDDFQLFEGLEYRVDILILPRSLKFIGLSTHGDFSLIELYHQKYSTLIDNKSKPETEIAMWQNLTTDNGEFDYVYGVVVDSLETIPDGLVGADTGFTKFAVITIRCKNMDELYDDNTFRTVHNNIDYFITPQYANSVCPSSPNSKRGYGTLTSDKNGDTSLIEIYPQNMEVNKTLNFYVPLLP